MRLEQLMTNTLHSLQNHRFSVQTQIMIFRLGFVGCYKQATHLNESLLFDNRD